MASTSVYQEQFHQVVTEINGQLEWWVKRNFLGEQQLIFGMFINL